MRSAACLVVQARERGGGGAERPTMVLVGDTLFPGSCGRLDLPDSDVDAMFASLVQLRELPEALKVYPGHGYAGESTTVGAEKKAGLLSPFSKEQFKKMFAR